jgi:hypothetical protein
MLSDKSKLLNNTGVADAVQQIPLYVLALLTHRITEYVSHYCAISDILTYDPYFAYNKVNVEEQGLLITFIELTRQRNLLRHDHFNYDVSVTSVFAYQSYVMTHTEQYLYTTDRGKHRTHPLNHCVKFCSEWLLHCAVLSPPRCPVEFTLYLWAVTETACVSHSLLLTTNFSFN